MERSSHRHPAVVVPIRGLDSGKRGFEQTLSADSIPGIVPEYVGDVHVTGDVLKVGQRFRVGFTVTAVAHLVCDRSLTEFDEPIESSLELEYIIDAELASSQVGQSIDSEEVRGLMPDVMEIDITDDIRQELALALPMRRVAPQFRDVEFDQIYHGNSQVSESTDDRWEALKKLK